MKLTRWKLSVLVGSRNVKSGREMGGESYRDISREIVRASDGGGYLFSGERGGGEGGGLRFPARIAVHDIGSINK